jgi:nickel superoxide dismutase
MKQFKTLAAVVFVTFFLSMTSLAWSHCEIPCGIYDDAARIEMILEHIGTIEKSMNMVRELERTQPINYNQLVRWISNKEHHANEIQEIVMQYFMTQRINFDTAKYQEKLEALHHLLVYAMKCKQTTDVANITAMKKAVASFTSLYFDTKK